jgi:F420-non-reducing hydrogenase iron-sulfur subunit
MCTGRIDPAFILRAFSNGVDGVFIGGCWLGECHYLTEGNHDAVSMMLLTRKLLEHIGLNPERLRLEWVSAAQGNRFAEVVTDFTNKLKELGPLGTAEGIIENRLKLKLEAARSLVPYLKLVERESLRVRFSTREEYEEFFGSDKVNQIFKESVIEKLAMQEILLLLREKPLSIDEFSEIMGLSQAEVSRYLNTSARHRLTRFDEKEKCFTLA